MSFLHNIRTVAQYESRTLRRSWFFRLFSVGGLVIMTFMNIGLFSPVGGDSWGLQAISSSVPYVNLYLLNIGQAIVVIFLAADFLRRDKKLDTSEVLYTRSMSNLEYILGKTWGIIRLFLFLDAIILSIGLLMNIISTDMSVDLLSYLQYLLIICVPTIVFSLGVAFVLMQVIRNQAVTFMVLLGYAALDMFYLYYRAGWIFDYMAFNLPLVKSGIAGFGNSGLIANQRLLYLFSGFALVMVTALLFKRLPQSKLQRVVTTILLILCSIGAIFAGFGTWNTHSARIRDKKQVIETNRAFENRKFPVIETASIDLVHKGKTIEASASLTIANENREDLETYLFSLNPSLRVTGIESGNRALEFKRTGHIIEALPGKRLVHGEKDSLKISYTGAVNEEFCYPDYSESSKSNPYMIAMLVINKRQAFLTDDFVLLTPESHWYPVAGLNYYPSDPARIKVDFTRYKLRVKSRDGLTAVSQGRVKKDEGHFSFAPEEPLTGLTLAIGNYMIDSLKAGSVEYLSYHFPGNDYYRKSLSALKDTLPQLISGIMRDLETDFSARYPFSTLSLVEVPVQFYSFPRMSTQTRAEVQPAMVLLPEKLSTLEGAGFGKRITRQKKRMVRNNEVLTDKEIQLRVFQNFVQNTFITGEQFRYRNGVAWNEPVRYRLGSSFYFFKNNFWSDEFPVINAVFETHLQKAKAPEQSGFFGFSSSLTENDQANLYLKKASFRDVLASNPLGDTLRQVLTVKGDYLFNLFREKAGIDKFDIWFRDYMNGNRFRSINIADLNDTISRKFGFEFYPFLEDWFNRKDQPGFSFSRLTASEIIVADRTRYQITFVASNAEAVSGLFNISVRTGADAGGRDNASINFGGERVTISVQGRGMEASDISKIVMLAPHETKRIGLVTDAQPREIRINTLFSMNLPGVIALPVSNISKKRENQAEFDGEELLASPPGPANSHEIIVDNEDPGFSRGEQQAVIPLKRLLGINYNGRQEYQEIRMWNLPDYWQPVVKAEYFGKYILSAVYTTGGKGDKSISWTTPVPSPGYYNIYCYVGKPADQVRIGSNEGDQDEENRGHSPSQDMHYKVYSDEGVEEITVDYDNAENGWNLLGKYRLTSDSARVVLTNQSTGRVVVGDAIRWVKAD